MSNGFEFSFGSVRESLREEEAERHDVSCEITGPVELQSVAACWCERFDRARMMHVEVSGFIVLFQRPPRVSTLEGDGRERSDVVQGRYYGGLKVWSCSIDLCRLLCCFNRSVNSTTPPPVPK